jgi:hypothetical protein
MKAKGGAGVQEKELMERTGNTIRPGDKSWQMWRGKGLDRNKRLEERPIA